jgi:uncharacterized protein YegP (UPF0339 family)
VAQTKKRPAQLTGKVYVERRPTAVLRKQSWLVRVVAANGEPIMTSEKYSRHIDALSAANLVAGGQFEVLDQLEQM